MLFSSYAIGLDIQEDTIHIVLLKKAGKSFELAGINFGHLETSIIQENRIIHPQALAHGLIGILQKAIPFSIKSTYPVICSLPESQIFLHIFSLPINLDSEDISQAILFEVEKIIPFPISELYFDYQIIGSNQNQQKILFACIHKNIADELKNVLESAGLKPQFFGLRNQALIKALTTAEDNKKNILIVDIDSFTIAITLIQTLTILNCDFTHITPAPVNEADINNFFQQILKKISATLTNLKSDIHEIRLCGTALKNPELYNYLKKNLKLEVNLGDPWKKITINKTTAQKIAATPEITKKKAVSFATSLGLAIGHFDHNHKNQNEINLIPSAIKEKNFLQALIRATNILCFLFITLVSGLLFLYLSAWGQLYLELHHFQASSNEIAKLQSSNRYQEIKTQISDFNKEVNLIAKLEKTLYSASIILTKLQEYIPPEITLNSINYDKKNAVINLTGIAQSREDIVRTKNRLKEFPFQKNIDSPLSNLDDKENISFVINVTLDPQKLPRFGSTVSPNNEAPRATARGIYPPQAALAALRTNDYSCHWLTSGMFLGSLSTPEASCERKARARSEVKNLAPPVLNRASPLNKTSQNLN